VAAKSLLAKIPDELVNELVAAGLATTPTGRRSGTWQVLATWASGAGTAISLLQGPQTISYLARQLRSRFQQPNNQESAEQAYVEAKGPGGQIRFPVNANTTTEEIERLLTATLFPDDK
jgi:hypothetical protein